MADDIAVSIYNIAVFINITDNFAVFVVSKLDLSAGIAEDVFADNPAVFIDKADDIAVFINDRAVWHNHADNIAVFINGNPSLFADAADDVAVRIHNFAFFI